MKVWLDDIRPMPITYSIHVKTAEEAIDLLLSGEVEEISLDNDLGLDDDGYELTQGKKVAQWIEEKSFHGELEPLKLNHHTDNVSAQIEMEKAFENATRFWKDQGKI